MRDLGTGVREGGEILVCLQMEARGQSLIIGHPPGRSLLLCDAVIVGIERNVFVVTGLGPVLTVRDGSGNDCGEEFHYNKKPVLL